ncbi:MAG TPA: hypothetical protein P5268_03040 [Candidatus Marinimicrobia bacterium]|nr:hypothetical protein [Candidatus Neomarinimicrobiota bacterium]HRS52203.1 hypothetical protein [Candidatus Neomarinimicrobiota bacterium]HRU91994.1 hypothetical protein [Candidatus Neomarinimicrobiota bacterium]
MNKMIRIGAFLILLVGLLFSAYRLGSEKGNTSILSVTTTAQDFNSVLASSLEQLEKTAPETTTGKIIINVDDAAIIVTVKMKDLQKLTRTEIPFDQFIRTYLKFS